MTTSVRPDDFLEATSVFGLNVHFGTCDGLQFGILYIPLESGRTDRRSLGGYARNEQGDKTGLERFNKHKISRVNRISGSALSVSKARLNPAPSS